MDNSESRHEPTSAPYGIVFLVLALFTGLEVGASYLPNPFRIPVLVALALVKAGLVLLYFMHLRTDRRTYALLFVIGLVVVIPLVLAISLATPHGG